MRISLDHCWNYRYPSPFFRYAENWSEDATIPTRNSSQHQIIDYGVGLFAVLVENV